VALTQLLNKVFGKNFEKNEFFRCIPVPYALKLMKTCHQVSYRPGEYVYTSDQNPNSSTRRSPVYLILEGRVNCIVPRNVCLKTFIQGSYFGDYEVFNESRRLFSVRAETFTRLAVIEADLLHNLLKSQPQVKHTLLVQSLRRYLSYKHSMHHIKNLTRISFTDLFWERTSEMESAINKKIADWLTFVAEKRRMHTNKKDRK